MPETASYYSQMVVEKVGEKTEVQLNSLLVKDFLYDFNVMLIALAKVLMHLSKG